VAEQKTHVTLVLDETGSMSDVADDTRGSVNEYFQEIASEFPDALVSIMEFSHQYDEKPTFRTLVNGVKASEVPKLTEQNYRPRGGTPLYDAVGKGIRDAEAIEADRHLFIVLTDGKENASNEWSLESVKKLVDEKENSDNWTIVFLGANMDAWAVGEQIGTKSGSTMSFVATAPGIKATTSSLSQATRSYLSSHKRKSNNFFGDAGQTREDYEDPRERRQQQSETRK
jgi:von Willebrand factor type A domain-containing protein